MEKNTRLNKLYKAWKEKMICLGYCDDSEITEKGFYEWIYNQIEGMW